MFFNSAGVACLYSNEVEGESHSARSDMCCRRTVHMELVTEFAFSTSRELLNEKLACSILRPHKFTSTRPAS